MLDNKFCDKKLFFPFNFTFTLFLHTRLDDVERGMPSLPLDNTHDWTTLSMASHHGPFAAYIVGHLAVPSSPMEYTHGRTTSGKVCHHCPRKTYMIGRHRLWLVINALRQHTRSDDVVRGMPSWTLGRSNNWMTLDVACLHRH